MSLTKPTGKKLWEPSAARVKASRLQHFGNYVSETYGYEGTSYNDLHAWSIKHCDLFWEGIWKYFKVKGQLGEIRLNRRSNLFESTWFDDSQLNFAENLLVPRYGPLEGSRDVPPKDPLDGSQNGSQNGKQADAQPITIDSYNENGLVERISLETLRETVAKLAHFLKQQGVSKGDRVAAFVPNTTHALSGMLAASSLGAVWSSCSPDFGVDAVLDRFAQIKPKVVIFASHYLYAQKVHALDAKAEQILTQLDSVEVAIRFEYVEHSPWSGSVKVHDWEAIQSADTNNLNFVPCQFNDPLYIMYSSGTTGKPKCIVHGIGGTLLQHLKEHALHTDLGPGDRLFFYTTCGWMMWNWLVSALSVGASVVLYDGSPFHPNKERLFDIVDETDTSVLGAGAKYFASCDKFGLSPAQSHSLSALKTTLSTGSPLLSQHFEYIYQEIKADQCVSSISGGTDIISCFALGCPIAPVYSGELQCKGLGMDIDFMAEDATPNALTTGESGELVCRTSFPSKPIYFWDDADGKKYRSAYFELSENLWFHGDFGQIRSHGETDGAVIQGRSDSVLNPGGVRIGTAEIYRHVESFDSVLESVAVGQTWQDDQRIILFVKLREGASLNEELVSQIKRRLREKASPKHVPAIILEAPDIPKTLSGKITEKAIRQLIHGETIANTDAIANPESLAFFSQLDLE